MCYSDYSKILIGKDRMILCPKQALDKKKVRCLIKKAFPELFTGWFDRWFKEVDYKVVCCYKSFSSQFDHSVNRLEKKNDWDKFPFMALKIVEKEDFAYCKDEPIVV